MSITMPGRKENAIQKRTQMMLDHDDYDNVLINCWFLNKSLTHIANIYLNNSYYLFICIMSGKSCFQLAFVAESFLFVTLNLQMLDVKIFEASKCNCRLKVDF